MPWVWECMFFYEALQTYNVFEVNYPGFSVILVGP